MLIAFAMRATIKYERGAQRCSVSMFSCNFSVSIRFRMSERRTQKRDLSLCQQLPVVWLKSTKAWQKETYEKFTDPPLLVLPQHIYVAYEPCALTRIIHSRCCKYTRTQHDQIDTSWSQAQIAHFALVFCSAVSLCGSDIDFQTLIKYSVAAVHEPTH